MALFRLEINALLLQEVRSRKPRLQGVCEELWNYREWLWNFVEAVTIHFGG